jgi:hypothetical protein
MDSSCGCHLSKHKTAKGQRVTDESCRQPTIANACSDFRVPPNSGRRPHRRLPEQHDQFLGEVAGGDALEIEERNQHLQVLRSACVGRQNRRRKAHTLGAFTTIGQRIGKSRWLGELENVNLALTRITLAGEVEASNTPRYAALPFVYKGTIKQQARVFLHWRKQMSKQMKRLDG